MGAGISLLKKVARSIDNANKKSLKEEKARAREIAKQEKYRKREMTRQEKYREREIIRQEKAQIANDKREYKENIRKNNTKLVESKKASKIAKQEYIKHILQNDKEFFENRVLQRKNMRIEIMRKILQ